MGSNIFSIGVSGMNAAQVALSVTGNNMANVHTPGYNVQTAIQTSRTSQNLGGGFLGKGVDITNVVRAYDKFLTAQVQNSQTSYSYYETSVKQLNQINNLMSDSTVGISPAIQDIFSAMQTLSQEPGSLPSRQVVLNMAQALATKFGAVNSQLQQIQDGANGQIKTTVDSINAIAQQIADLNLQIAALTGGDQSGPQPNTLLDQRDQAVYELNKLVEAKVVVQDNGQYAVYVGSGQTLVVGNQINTLATQPSASDPLTLDLVFNNPNGTVTPIPNGLMTGGALGGLLNFRDGPLLEARTQLGQLAINFAEAMNYQNQLGVDLYGNPGQPIFTDLSSYASQPQYAAGNLSVLISDPKLLAAASNMVPTGTTGGVGATMSGVWSSMPDSVSSGLNTNPPVLPNVNTHPSIGMTGMTITTGGTAPITMTATIAGPNGGGPYNVVPDPNLPNGYKLQTIVVPPATAQDVGIGFQLSASPALGQQFTVGPGSSLPADGGNLRQLLAQQNKPLVNGQSYQTYYSTLVSSIGSQTNTAQLGAAASANTLEQVATHLSNVTGVNLDQELANLMKFQQSYQASSKVIQTASTLFNSVLNMIG